MLLTERFGQEIENYYSCSGINRLSFLRDDYDFIYKAIRHPKARFIVFGDKLEVLVKGTNTTKTRGELYLASYKDLESVLGTEVAYAKPEQEIIADWSSQKHAIGAGRVLSVFLGLRETSTTNTESGVTIRDFHGEPYFAVDLSVVKITNPELEDKVKAVRANLLNNDEVFFVNGLRVFKLNNKPDYALFGQARIYVDWNARNRFCAGCGRRNMSVNAGCKLVCPEKDNHIATEECETRGTVSNLSFPRTDSSIIVAVLNKSGTKVLLGSGRRFPKGMYSCLAGFLEPGESIEECVRREVWEESGVKVGRVVVHSTQPWPYPANIMVGCIAQVTDEPGAESIHLEHDPELADAQWVPVEQLDVYLQHASLSVEKRQEFGDPMFVPYEEAVAHVLLRAAVRFSQEAREEREVSERL